MNNIKLVTNSQQEPKEAVKISSKRGIFPRLSLFKTLELSKAIYEIGEGELVRRLIIFDRLGKSPESGSSRMLVIASSMYGLTKGSYQAEHLELTDIGRSLSSLSPDSKKYIEVVYNILFDNNLFSEFMDYWKNKSLPSDEIATDWLVRTYGLSDADAKSSWEVIKMNILDWKLTEILSGRKMIITKEAALESIKDELYAETVIGEPIEQTGSVTSSPSVNVRRDENKSNVVSPKPFGTQILERDFTYGRARLILPSEMTLEEINKLKLLIEGLVKEVQE